MKFRKLLSALLFTTGVLFVAGFTRAASPTEVAEKCFKALANCDFVTAAELCHGKLKIDLATIDKMYRASDAKRQLKMRNNARAYFGSIRITGEKIEGDFALLDSVQGDKPKQQYLKKVNGEWKCIDDSEYRSPADSPSEVAREFIGLLRNSDFAAAARLCDGKLKTETEQIAEQYNASTPEQQKKTRDALVAFTNGVVFKGETIEGDFAVVEIATEGQPDKMYFKRVAGKWKCIDGSEYKK